MPEALTDIGNAHSLGAFMLMRLKADIISTQLKPGMKLALHQMAEHYKVGITPLRDALGQLAGDGLVVMESQKGFRVAPISPEDLRDICDIRLRTELMALEMAFERQDSGWDIRLKRAFADFVHVKARVGEDVPISDEWERCHRAIHMALVSACGSPTLLRFCGQIHDRIHRYRRVALPTKSFMGALGDDHADITDAALARDKVRCMALLEGHILSSSRLIEENIEFGSLSGGSKADSVCSI